MTRPTHLTKPAFWCPATWLGWWTGAVTVGSVVLRKSSSMSSTFESRDCGYRHVSHVCHVCRYGHVCHVSQHLHFLPCSTHSRAETAADTGMIVMFVPNSSMKRRSLKTNDSVPILLSNIVYMSDYRYNISTTSPWMRFPSCRAPSSCWPS